MGESEAGFKSTYEYFERPFFAAPIWKHEKLVEWSVLPRTTRTNANEEKEFFFLPIEKKANDGPCFHWKGGHRGIGSHGNARNFIGRGVHPCTFFGARVLRPVSAALRHSYHALKSRVGYFFSFSPNRFLATPISSKFAST